LPMRGRVRRLRAPNRAARQGSQPRRCEPRHTGATPEPGSPILATFRSRLPTETCPRADVGTGADLGRPRAGGRPIPGLGRYERGRLPAPRSRRPYRPSRRGLRWHGALPEDYPSEGRRDREGCAAAPALLLVSVMRTTAPLRAAGY
jgi:hypothetical protein